MDFLDGLEAKTAMMTISKNIKLGEKDANNGRIGVSFKKHEFSDFFIGPVFFFNRNPPPHLRGRVRASFCRERRLKIHMLHNTNKQ
jgi:hypothetical protein